MRLAAQFAVELARQLRSLGAGGGAAGGAEVQAALWLRVALLPPLLPLVYADRDQSATGNLRGIIAPTLLTCAVKPALLLRPALALYTISS